MGVVYFQGIEVQSKLAQFVREILPDAKRLAWIAIPPDLIKVEGGGFRPEPCYAKISQRLGLDLGYYEGRKAMTSTPSSVRWRRFGIDRKSIRADHPAVRAAAGRSTASRGVRGDTEYSGS